VIRLIGTLLMFTVTAGGYMFYDFKMSARLAGGDAAETLTFSEYLSGLSGRIAGLSVAASASGLPTKLADMLPRPPEGWKARALVPEDVDPFLPASKKKADKAAVAALKSMLKTDSGEGTEVATLAYQKGDRTVLVRAVRYPNQIFTGFTALDQRKDLQSMGAQFRGSSFMTVRGLDVTEDLLPEGFRGRFFLADVGGQIHLRVLAPKRMTDEELVGFFETLHVEAMNASVIDKVEGLGKVPMVILASALDDADRDAYYASRTARAEAEAVREEAGRAAALAEAEKGKAAEDIGLGDLIGSLFGSADQPQAADTTPAAKPELKDVDCSTKKDGVKRCKVGATEG
jgi:hypothetical protein